MPKVKNVVICAAGLGSRLGLNMPKCMVEMGSKRIIGHLLENLKDIENVRIVVGYKEEEVIDYVKKIRKDVLFVRNPNYNNTTNAYSLYLGTHDLHEPFLTVDGDMILNPKSFQHFLRKCEKTRNLIGVTKATTEDAVFVNIENNHVTAFSRKPIGAFEWSGIGYFSDIRISKDGKYVYQELENMLPLPASNIKCFEIDTPADLDYATENIDFI